MVKAFSTLTIEFYLLVSTEDRSVYATISATQSISKKRPIEIRIRDRAKYTYTHPCVDSRQTKTLCHCSVRVSVITKLFLLGLIC
ncbi:MAG: hypothetical protein ACKE51_09155, partial [Methylococcaceae bacterium]